MVQIINNKDGTTTHRNDFPVEKQKIVNTPFPNKAGDHADTDDILKQELTDAGIKFEFLDILRKHSGEVKTGVIGGIFGWTFKRAWTYWSCEGPGIPVEAAEKLHKVYGKVVRVDGDCGCPSPRERFHGLGCGSYHVDTKEGLKALVETLRNIVTLDGI